MKGVEYKEKRLHKDRRDKRHEFYI